MKKTILALSLTMVCASISYSQEAPSRLSTQGQSEKSVAGKTKHIDIQSGTRLEAQLQNSLDVRKAKVGDEVVLKTSKAIKSGGRIVVDKGARLIGHVTEVEQKTKANGESRIGLVFDRLEKGSLEFPISATITSITRGIGSARVSDDELFTTSGGQSSTSAQSNAGAQNRGGLLGDVTNTAGGAVNSVTGVATGAAVQTTGSITNPGLAGGGTGQSIGRVRIIEFTGSSAEVSSMLSLQGGNLRLEKGTTVKLVFNQSANADAPEKQ